MDLVFDFDDERKQLNKAYNTSCVVCTLRVGNRGLTEPKAACPCNQLALIRPGTWRRR